MTEITVFHCLIFDVKYNVYVTKCKCPAYVYHSAANSDNTNMSCFSASNGLILILILLNSIYCKCGNCQRHFCGKPASVSSILSHIIFNINHQFYTYSNLPKLDELQKLGTYLKRQKIHNLIRYYCAMQIYHTKNTDAWVFQCNHYFFYIYFYFYRLIDD